MEEGEGETKERKQQRKDPKSQGEKRKVPGGEDRPRSKLQISFPQLLSYSEKGDMTREQ